MYMTTPISTDAQIRMLIPFPSGQFDRCIPPRARGARPSLLRAHTDYSRYHHGALVPGDYYDDVFPRHRRRGIRNYGYDEMDPYYTEYM